jgi:hypothetical protein
VAASPLTISNSMRNELVKYLRLSPGDTLPTISDVPFFKAVVVIESDVPEIWQWELSRWLVSSGCRYMLAWGKECQSWAESVDEANQEAFNYEDIPEDALVITTSHEDEDLDEVFWFAKHRALHPAHDLQHTVIVHVSDVDRRNELEDMVENA